MSAQRTAEQALREKELIERLGNALSGASGFYSRKARRAAEQAEAMYLDWVAAAKRLKARKLSKAENKMYGCDG